MSQQAVLSAMYDLAQQGKAITTAAVKARLTTPVPLPELLALVSRYKQSPHDLPSPAVKPALVQDHQCEVPRSSEHAALVKRVVELESTVAQLMQNVAHLENELQLARM